MISKNPTRKHPRRTALAVVVLTGAVGLAGIAHAGPWGRHHHGPGPGGMMRGLVRLVDSLDLTEQQELKLVRIRRTAREEGKAMREAMRTDVDALLELLDGENPDRDAVHARIDAMMARVRGRAHAMADRALDFHAELTPEQKKKLAAEIAERRERRAKRRARWEARLDGPESEE